MPEDGGLPSDSHLSDAERERLHPGIDVDALERLLAALPPGTRDIVLDAFDVNPRFRAFEEGVRSISLARGLDGRSVIPTPLELVFTDPELQQLLDPMNAALRAARAAEARRRQEPEWYQRVERPAREAPVLLVMPPEWDDDDATAVVVRRTDATQRDIILVDAARADAGVLDVALEALLAERRHFGATPRRAHTIRIGATRPVWLPPVSDARLDDILRQLREEPERIIKGIGLVRAMEFRIAD